MSSSANCLINSVFCLFFTSDYVLGQSTSILFWDFLIWKTLLCLVSRLKMPTVSLSFAEDQCVGSFFPY